MSNIIKSQPSRTQIHVDSTLTNLSIAYAQQNDVFVADKVAPAVPSPKQSNKYFTFDKDEWRRSDARRRGPAEESAGTGYSVSTGSFYADVWALHHDVPWQDRDNADSPLDLDRDAAEFITQQMLIRREVQFASDIFTTSTWTGSSTAGDLTASPLWSDDASTPIQDIEDQRAAILENNGGNYGPNFLLLGYDAYKALRHHPDLLDRVKYTQRGVITTDLMAALFDVERVLVARASYNTAAEAVTATNDFVLGQGRALLGYAPPRAGLRIPSAAYTFTWTGHVPNALGITFDRFDIREIKATRIEAEMAFDFKVTGATLGAFWTSAA